MRFHRWPPMIAADLASATFPGRLRTTRRCRHGSQAAEARAEFFGGGDSPRRADDARQAWGAVDVSSVLPLFGGAGVAGLQALPQLVRSPRGGRVAAENRVL